MKTHSGTVCEEEVCPRTSILVSGAVCLIALLAHLILEMKSCFCLQLCQPQTARPLSEGQPLHGPCCKLEESEDAPASTALSEHPGTLRWPFPKGQKGPQMPFRVGIQSQLSAQRLNIARAEMHRLVGATLHNCMKPVILFAGSLC